MTLRRTENNSIKVEVAIFVPTTHKMFTDGFHVVRRNDRYWGGLSTDLTIEQILMKRWADSRFRHERSPVISLHESTI